MSCRGAFLAHVAVQIVAIVMGTMAFLSVTTVLIVRFRCRKVTSDTELRSDASSCQKRDSSGGWGPLRYPGISQVKRDLTIRPLPIETEPRIAHSARSLPRPPRHDTSAELPVVSYEEGLANLGLSFAPRPNPLTIFSSIPSATPSSVALVPDPQPDGQEELRISPASSPCSVHAASSGSWSVGLATPSDLGGDRVMALRIALGVDDLLSHSDRGSGAPHSDESRRAGRPVTQATRTTIYPEDAVSNYHRSLGPPRLDGRAKSAATFPQSEVSAPRRSSVPSKGRVPRSGRLSGWVPSYYDSPGREIELWDDESVSRP